MKLFGRPRRYFAALIPLIGCMLLCGGCVITTPTRSWSESHSKELRDRLVALSDQVDSNEAARMADAAVEKAIALAQQYRAVWPPWLHNNLVNRRFRARGLCYDWANDMFASLHEIQGTSLRLHLAVARMDTRREHNALVVTAVGRPFNQGVVLDAWRHSGRVWSGPVETDKYPWQPLPYERVNPALQKLVTQ